MCAEKLSSTNNNMVQKVREIIDKGSSHLQWATRFDFRTLDMEQLKEIVWKKGLPLVIGNTTLSWRRDRELFSFDWLKKNFGSTSIIPRNNDTFEDESGWTVAEFLSYMSQGKEERKKQLSAHNILSPEPWKEFIGSRLKDYYSKGPNDLMGELIPDLQTDTVMTSLGVEDSFISGQFSIVGSLYYNLMVYADEGAYSLWFCVASADKERAIDFWKRSVRGNSGSLINQDAEWMSLEALTEAPFNVYVIEQREGDFILIPPQSAHQYMNKNGRNVQVQWNIVSCSTIENSYFGAREMFRSWGRPELFRIKALAYYGLMNRTQSAFAGKTSTELLADEFPPLLSIVEDMIESEWIGFNESEEKEEEELAIFRFTDDNIPHQRVCNFCKADIWNRCYHCNKCTLGYDICLPCVAVGRGCLHKEEMILMEYISMRSIKQQFEKAKEAYQKVLRSVKRKKNKKKFIEWKSKPPSKKLSDATIAHRLIKLYSTQNTSDMCHQCQKIQPFNSSILINCTHFGCDNQYCTKCLWNRYGQKLSDCFLNKNWVCPSCRNSCNCAPCLENKGLNPNQFSCESLLAHVLDLPYPFSSYEPPNVPAISDFKPVYYSHALKKRKMYVAPTSTSPTSPPTPPSKTERLGPVKHLIRRQGTFSSTPASPPLNNSSPSDQQHQFSETTEEQDQFMTKEESPNLNNSTLNGERLNSSQDSQLYREDWSKRETDQRTIKDAYDNDYELYDQDDAFRESYGHHEVDHKTTLLVRNLSYACTSEDLGVFFNTCGEIDQITIPLDRSTNKLRGYGFVKFKKREDAERAMEKYNRLMLKDRVIELEWSVDKTARKALDRNSICYKCKKRGHFARNCAVPISNPPNEHEMSTNSPLLSSSAPFQASSFSTSSSSSPFPAPSTSTSFPPASSGSSSFLPSSSFPITSNTIPYVSSPTISSSQSSTQEYNNSSSMDIEKSKKELRGYICFKCGKEGHVAQNCPDREDTGPGFKAVICFKCGQVGHLANKCDKKNRACFICGRDGHIAAECSENTHRDRHNNSYYNGEEEISEPSHKYRKINPSMDNHPSPRIPTKSWSNDRSLEWDYSRERKSSSRDLRMYTDPRSTASSSNMLTNSRLEDSRHSSSYYPSYSSSMGSYSSSRDPLPYDDRSRNTNQSSRMSTSSESRSSIQSHSYTSSSNSRLSHSGDSQSLPDGLLKSFQSIIHPTSDTNDKQSNNFYGMENDRNGPILDPSFLNTGGRSGTTFFPPTDQGSNSTTSNNSHSYQNGTNSSANSLAPSSSSHQSNENEKEKEKNEKRRNFKLYVTPIVISRLSRYFNGGKIKSKDHFKQLSRKIIHSSLEKEHPLYLKDNNTEQKLKNSVDQSFNQYIGRLQQDPQKLDQWLNSTE